MKNKKPNGKAAKTYDPVISFRLGGDTRKHYEQLAAADRRSFSQVIRIALEDHARGVCGQRKVAKV